MSNITCIFVVPAAQLIFDNQCESEEQKGHYGNGIDHWS